MMDEAQNHTANTRKRKADCLSKETGIVIPPARLVPETTLQNVPECVRNELHTLRVTFNGSSIKCTSANSVEPALLFLDPQRLPGKAHFGILAKHNFKRGELVAEEFSHQRCDSVPFDQIEDHFKMMIRLNHSCAPNVIVQFVLVTGDHGPEASGIKYWASRDIVTGEELCKEYFDVCQPLEQRKRMSAFVCNCPVCNLPLEERCRSDERREEISRVARLEAGSCHTAEEAWCLMSNVRDARILSLLEKIGDGPMTQKLSALEVDLLHQVKTCHPLELKKLEDLSGESFIAWEAAVLERKQNLSNTCSSSGLTVQLASAGSLQNGTDSEEEDEQGEEELDTNHDDGMEISLHIASVRRDLEKLLPATASAAELQQGYADLIDLEAQCRRIGLDADVLQALDALMAASGRAEESQMQSDLSSVSCEVDVDGADDPDLRKRMQADVLACMGDYFRVLWFHQLATNQYRAALAIDETNCSAKLGLEKLKGGT